LLETFLFLLHFVHDQVVLGQAIQIIVKKYQHVFALYLSFASEIGDKFKEIQVISKGFKLFRIPVIKQRLDRIRVWIVVKSPSDLGVSVILEKLLEEFSDPFDALRLGVSSVVPRSKNGGHGTGKQGKYLDSLLNDRGTDR
jgi:hypothetical protein